MNGKFGAVDKQLLKTPNRKQQNRDNVLYLIGWKLWNQARNFEWISPFEPMRDPDNRDVRVIFFSHGFSLGHVIITTIIIFLRCPHQTSKQSDTKSNKNMMAPVGQRINDR